MPKTRPQEDPESTGYPAMSVIKQNEGLEDSHNLKELFDNMEPLKNLDFLPAKSTDRIFTIAEEKERRKRPEKVDIERRKTPHSYEEEKEIMEEEKKPKVHDKRTEEKENTPSSISDPKIELLGPDSKPIPHAKIDEFELSQILNALDELSSYYNEENTVQGIFSKPEALKQFIDLGVLEISNDIGKESVGIGIGPFLRELESTLINVIEEEKTASLNIKSKDEAVAETIRLAKLFITRDQHVLQTYINSNTIETSGRLGIYSYELGSIITSNNATFLKLNDDSVSYDNKETGEKETIRIINAFGTDGNKYVLLPDQIKNREVGTYTIKEGVYLYRNYPKIIYGEAKKVFLSRGRENVQFPPIDKFDWDRTTREGNRFLLPHPVVVKKLPGGTTDFSPADGNLNVRWASIQIISRKPTGLRGDVFAVEERYLNKNVQTTAGLNKLASDDLFPTDPPGTWRLWDKPSETQIDQSSAGNEEPIQKSRGLVPFKMPGYNDPSIKMSEYPEIEFNDKNVDYKKLLDKVKNVNSQISKYLIDKIGNRYT
jgi:hypothetical protein